MQDGAQRALPAYRSMSDALATIWRAEGLRGLYAGLAPSLIGEGGVRACMCVVCVWP